MADAVTTAALRATARATVAGVCVGDAIGWPSWWHRLSRLTPRREVRLTQAWQHARDIATTGLPTPYLQSSPPSDVDPAGPTDDAEWFAVAALHHLGRRLDGSPATGDRTVWHELATLRAADPGAVRARVGTVIALQNLARGVQPPTSGHDNPHYFDDIACVRAVAAALARPGDPAGAVDLAGSDALVTHSLDGVWGSGAVAGLLSVLLGGGSTADAERAALTALPPDSWVAHVVAECLDHVRDDDDQVRLAARLERRVVDHVYAYANQAPETLGLLLAHLRVARSAEALLLGALAHPRHADGLVPLAGAVGASAFGDRTADPEPLPVLRGTCVRALDGVALDDLVDDLLAAGHPVP